MAGMAKILVFSALVLSGCRTYDYTLIKTGLFNNNLQAMMAAYQKIVPDLTTREELKNLGFNLDAPNVKRLDGPRAMKQLFGDNFFQNAFVTKSKLEEFLIELNYYEMVIVPYQDITQISDRFYISDKETYKKGDDLNIYIVFKDDKVVYRAKNYTEIKETRTSEAFLQGLLDLFEKFPLLKYFYKN